MTKATKKTPVVAKEILDVESYIKDTEEFLLDFEGVRVVFRTSPSFKFSAAPYNELYETPVAGTETVQTIRNRVQAWLAEWVNAIKRGALRKVEVATIEFSIIDGHGKTANGRRLVDNVRGSYK